MRRSTIEEKIRERIYNDSTQKQAFYGPTTIRLAQKLLTDLSEKYQLGCEFFTGVTTHYLPKKGTRDITTQVRASNHGLTVSYFPRKKRWEVTTAQRFMESENQKLDRFLLDS